MILFFRNHGEMHNTATVYMNNHDTDYIVIASKSSRNEEDGNGQIMLYDAIVNPSYKVDPPCQVTSFCQKNTSLPYLEQLPPGLIKYANHIMYFPYPRKMKSNHGGIDEFDSRTVTNEAIAPLWIAEATKEVAP